MMNKYNRIIVDGNNFVFRAYFTKRKPKILNGINTTPIHQFLYMLRTLAETHKPDKFVFAWDKKLNTGGLNFRKTLTESYKGNRVESDAIKDIFTYIPVMESFCKALGITSVNPYNLEGDDVIAFLSRKNYNNLIVSTDRDLLQLVSDTTHQYIPSLETIVTLDNFEEITNISKDAFLYYKAIVGDVSDNIPGLDGYGEIRGKTLANKIMANGIDNVGLKPEQVALIKNALRIIDLSVGETESPIDYQKYNEQYDMPPDSFNEIAFIELLKKYQFHNFIRELGIWHKYFNICEDDGDDFDLSRLIM